MFSWWKTKTDAATVFGASSDTGLARVANEDFFGRYPATVENPDDEQIYIIADGMGGHVRGRDASEAAVEIIQRDFLQAVHRNVETRLTEAFESANESVRRLALENRGKEKMGTTCTALVYSGGEVYLAHVGDTRAYRIRNGSLEQLTLDHSLVEELRRDGVLSDDEARDHPKRNALTRAIGTKPHVDVDVMRIGRPAPDDYYVLCTDGLSGIPLAQIRDTVLAMEPQAASERLVEMANSLGGYDNVTVMILRFT